MKLSKAVIPAAGFGTRMLPAAKAVPKELLPVLGTPTIQYVVEEAMNAGFDEIILINSKEKPALEAHFKPDRALDERLGRSGREKLLESLNRIIENVRVRAVYQHEQLGLGHAVAQARAAVGNEPFLCMLGDAIFSRVGDSKLPAQQLREVFERYGTSVIGLEEVPVEKVERYGIVGGDVIAPGVLKLNALVEKPPRDKAPSRFAIAARYLLTPAIFQCLDETKPGKGGEIQLTDALQLLLQREPIHGVVLTSRRHDIGDPIDWLKTNLVFASQDQKTWSAIAPLLGELGA